MANLYWLLIGMLVVWRVTHLLNAEAGPWELIARLRERLGGGLFGKLFDCFYCLSLWIALPLAWTLGDGPRHRLLLWPALSAGAILVERLTHRDDVLPAPWVEGETEDELLRTRDDHSRRSD